MTTVPNGAEGPQADQFEPEWMETVRQMPPRDPSLGFFLNHETKAAAEKHEEKIFEEYRRIEEAKTERERLKVAGIAPPAAAPSSIRLEIAMARDTATVSLRYLYDPFLPSGCVVGFFGRGGSAKSSFLASLAALVSEDASTLWVSVEEQVDWIKVRHMKCGAAEGTLAVVAAVPSKVDVHGRVIGSSYNTYEHLEASILAAQARFDNTYNPPRPLRLVVLDTAVGLTTWAKGESPNDDASVKRLLGFLQHLAETHDLTIAIIGHSNKGKHDYFADTVAGATAWTNSPRLSFVHANDRREEFACVMQVAKSNLTTRFAASYSTEPVHTLHHRAEGADSVLCRVNFGEVVWGEEASSELFEAATKKPQEDEGEGDGGDRRNHKANVVQKLMIAVTDLVYRTDEPVTREMVEAAQCREFSRREWAKVDERFTLAPFQWKVILSRGPQNKVLYQRQT